MIRTTKIRRTLGARGQGSSWPDGVFAARAHVGIVSDSVLFNSVASAEGSTQEMRRFAGNSAERASSRRAG